MANNMRIPTVGDKVGLGDKAGTYVVSGVNHNTKLVNLEKIGSQGTGAHGVPWSLLSHRDELDESQNALRVVREATEE